MQECAWLRINLYRPELLLSWSFLASAVGAPPSLQAAVIDVEVDKLPARALLDTGATESYIHEELVKKLKLKSQGELSRTSLASVGTSAQVRGFILVPVHDTHKPHSGVEYTPFLLGHHSPADRVKELFKSALNVERLVV